jgi:glycosyltransferase involved in cell wall biosynthesis
VGDGPLARRVHEASERFSGVVWLGRKSLEETYHLMGRAALVVFPTRVFETFGRVVVEAFAKGTPVVASRIGTLKELIEEGRNGLLFEPGDPKDLIRQVEWLLERPDVLSRMHLEARKTYEEQYTAEQNYRMLMDIYRDVITSGVGANAPVAAANEAS